MASQSVLFDDRQAENILGTCRVHSKGPREANICKNSRQWQTMSLHKMSVNAMLSRRRILNTAPEIRRGLKRPWFEETRTMQPARSPWNSGCSEKLHRLLGNALLHERTPDRQASMTPTSFRTPVESMEFHASVFSAGALLAAQHDLQGASLAQVPAHSLPKARPVPVGHPQDLLPCKRTWLLRLDALLQGGHWVGLHNGLCRLRLHHHDLSEDLSATFFGSAHSTMCYSNHDFYGQAGNTH